MNNLIVGIGEALWDVLPEGKKIGGAPANFAYHVSQFGLQSRVVSAVGFDALGEEILETFASRDLETLIERVGYPTGTVQVSLDAVGIPQYEIQEGVAWDNIPYTESLEELAKQCRAVCFGSLAQRSEVSRQTIQKFLDALPQGGDTLIVFDINLRQQFYTKDVICSSLERCNILKINDEELLIVSKLLGLDGLTSEEQCLQLLERYSLRLVILTCGVEGSYVYSTEGISFFPTPLVQVADTVGAGDSFTAAFISALIRGKGIREAHRLAVDTSAYVCTQAGAMPKLPEELLY